MSEAQRLRFAVHVDPCDAGVAQYLKTGTARTSSTTTVGPVGASSSTVRMRVQPSAARGTTSTLTLGVRDQGGASGFTAYYDNIVVTVTR